jgi:hypothetical protein
MLFVFEASHVNEPSVTTHLFRNLILYFFLAVTVDFVEHDVSSSPKSNARLFNWGLYLSNNLEFFCNTVTLVSFV